MQTKWKIETVLSADHNNNIDVLLRVSEAMSVSVGKKEKKEKNFRWVII